MGGGINESSGDDGGGTVNATAAPSGGEEKKEEDGGHGGGGIFQKFMSSSHAPSPDSGTDHCGIVSSPNLLRNVEYASL
ncbi:hypothetical protein PR202_gb19545 [Eleusine coracana subsp. coracana]|uniref:Uncharacterized protein n=1 Tax=Eleusine coracana subsp. coracana TaxID=191504 RepID=A0AAV5F9Y5_ELECO|nr:hypothetical protein PR202_gb19545 [Eleusine coracana subsp. coracana]